MQHKHEQLFVFSCPLPEDFDAAFTPGIFLFGFGSEIVVNVTLEVVGVDVILSGRGAYNVAPDYTWDTTFSLPFAQR